MARPKWTKIRETLGANACGTLKIDGLAPDAIVRVENPHQNGQTGHNIKLLGKYRFIERHQWELPEADGMEFDQYDTPASRWVAVHEFGQVLAGVRLTPTTARCGIYSYMIRDA